MAQKRYNAKNGITVGGAGGATPIDFIDETGQILSGTRISFLANPTITTNQPLFNATQTWNNAATPFTAFTMNITDTASNASSRLMDMQVGGVSKFYVDKTGNVVVVGDLTVQGTTVTINTATMDVADTNISLGKVATPTDVTANGGGITLLGTTNKTIVWDSANANWTSSENWNIVTGKTYKINNVAVLSATGLGTSVVSSSLTSVGTLTVGVWNASVIGGQYGGTGVANTGKSITLDGNLTTSGAFPLTLTSTAATNVTLPTTGTLATLAGVETLTNKSISGATNTLSAIPNAALVNSTISGVALGGTLAQLTVGSYLVYSIGGAYTGSAATQLSVDASSTNVASKVVVRDASGNFAAGTITATLSGNAATASVAAVATALQTARTINSVSFDGSANITITANTTNSLTIGSYLTGGSFNGGAAITIAVDATSINTASKVVARDASGNFAAGTITATLSGNASSATVLQTARTINGVSFNGSANITVADSTKLPLSGGTLTGGVNISSGTSNPLTLTTSSVGPWAITFNRSDLALSTSIYNDTGSRLYFQHRPSFAGAIAIDATNVGSYAPGLTGAGASGTWGIAITGNSATASTLSGDQTNWASNRSNAVSNMLGWKNYGNGHVIFDASQGTSPSGVGVSNVNSQIAWSATFPTLMGWNGINTYGVRVDSARVADSATTATQLASFESAELPLTVNTSYSIVTNHGLGRIPKTVELVLRCKVANNGYNIGDEIIINSIWGDVSGVGNMRIYTWKSTTQIGAGIVYFQSVINKAGTVEFTPTNSWWAFVFRAA